MTEPTQDPVEVTTRYATTVDDLPAAWAFVMAKVDTVGPDPSITISPLWVISVQDMDDDENTEYQRRFSVVVEGMVPEESP